MHLVVDLSIQGNAQTAECGQEGYAGFLAVFIDAAREHNRIHATEKGRVTTDVHRVKRLDESVGLCYFSAICLS